jgi:hypothetical protein
MKNNQPSIFLDFTAYVIGAAIGLFLIVISTWADLEATSYGFERLASGGLGGLRCPILMTPEESSTISFTISNPTDDLISPSIKTQVSTALLPEEYLEHLRLAPAASQRLQWTVGPENIDLEKFIFAKVLVYSAYPLPSRETTCGIFVVNLPGNGQVILAILILLSFLGMGWGLYSLNRSRSTSIWLAKRFAGLVFVALVIVIGCILSFTGKWLLSVLLMVVLLLTILVLIGTALTADSKRTS